jgi:hypothetical protein
VSLESVELVVVSVKVVVAVSLVFWSPGLGEPGVPMSPARTGTLRAKQTIPAVQIAFRVLIVVSYSVFWVCMAVAEEGGQLLGLLTWRIITAS